MPLEPKSRFILPYLLFTVFVCGAIVMMIEISGARVIAPLFGSSVFVWSAVISVTLVSLALGYFRGGRDADSGRGSQDYLYLVILLAGAYLFASLFLRKPVLSFAVNFGLRFGSLVSAFVLFAPPLFLLGMVSPLAVKLYTKELSRIGSSVGSLYFVSTLGSFLGTLVCGFILIPQFGISRIILFTAGSLAALSFVYYLWRRLRSGYLSLFLVIICAFMLFKPEGLATASVGNATLKERYKADSFYGRLKIAEINGVFRFLLIDGANQGGAVIRDGSSAALYTYVMEAIAYKAFPGAGRVLVVGLGPGTIPNDLSRKGIVTDVVEIDRKVAGIYRSFFSQWGRQEKIGIYIDDGRAFLNRAGANYDAALLDVLTGDAVPWHLLTKEAFLQFRRRLNPGGCLVINFIGIPGEKTSDAIMSAMHKTLAQVFPFVAVFNSSIREGSKAQNMFFLASLGKPDLTTGYTEPPVPENFRDEILGILQDYQTEPAQESFELTDDFNPFDYYNARTREVWRRDIISAGDKALMLD